MKREGNEATTRTNIVKRTLWWPSGALPTWPSSALRSRLLGDHCEVTGGSLRILGGSMQCILAESCADRSLPQIRGPGPTWTNKNEHF